MPLYEYACDECKLVTEMIKSVKDCDDPVICEKCQRETRRMVSRSSFTLKGGGWASDGYSGSGT